MTNIGSARRVHRERGQCEHRFGEDVHGIRSFTNVSGKSPTDASHDGEAWLERKL